MEEFYVHTITKNMETDEITYEKTINHGNHDSRVWLANHIHWALRNNHGVQLEPLTDKE